MLALDRVFFLSDALDFLSGKKVSFMIPARRNSPLYDDVTEMNVVFGYRGRMISAGKRVIGNVYAYIYLDRFLKAEEECPLYERLQKKLMDANEFNRKGKGLARYLSFQTWTKFRKKFVLCTRRGTALKSSSIS